MRKIFITLMINALVLTCFIPARLVHADENQAQDFIRARIVADTVFSQVDGTGEIVLTIDDNIATFPINFIKGENITGEIQMPFFQGNYSLMLNFLENNDYKTIMRVCGILTCIDSGVYEHKTTELMADPSYLDFDSGGVAITIEVGSIQGSAQLYLLASSSDEMHVSIALDSDGDGLISSADVKKEEKVLGPKTMVETSLTAGLPLTSRVHINVRDEDNNQIVDIEGPYDLANMNASAQPIMELNQDKITSVLVILKRVPMLTRIEIPTVKIAPPSETINVESQRPAQNTLAAFGNTEGLKTLVQEISLQNIVPTEEQKVFTDNDENVEKTNNFFSSVQQTVSKLVNSIGLPGVIILGSILITCLTAAILWIVLNKRILRLEKDK